MQLWSVLFCFALLAITSFLRHVFLNRKRPASSLHAVLYSRLASLSSTRKWESTCHFFSSVVSFYFYKAQLLYFRYRISTGHCGNLLDLVRKPPLWRVISHIPVRVPYVYYLPHQILIDHTCVQVHKRNVHPNTSTVLYCTFSVLFCSPLSV